jgi:hypothetical protein
MVQQLQYGLKLIKEIFNNQLRSVTSNITSGVKISSGVETGKNVGKSNLTALN